LRRRRQHAAARAADAARNGDGRDAPDDGDGSGDGRVRDRDGDRAGSGVRFGETGHERRVFGEARCIEQRSAQKVKRVFAIALLVACGKPAAEPIASVRHLDPSAPWLARNRARIDRMLDELHGQKRVAVFDWDNTMMRNDIGDATFFYMLRHDLILQPPNRDWSLTNKHLTMAARTELAVCDIAGEPGRPLQTTRFSPCADVLVRIYDGGKTLTDKVAFDEDTKTMHHAYAWGAQLQAGHTPDEMRAIATRAYEENAAAPIGTTQTIGTTKDLAAWVRIYEPMHDLQDALRAAGFDVWVVSASAQWLVEVVASHVGVDASHAVGIRAIVKDGKLDYRLQGCGTEPDGADTVITFNEGKRCWINRAIFRLPESEQLSRATDPAKRPTFAAGDSDTDLAMVQDATTLKLVIDRNKRALMCNAWNDAGDRWLVQPMFVEPLTARAEPYECAGLVDEDGKPIQGSLSPLR
jgi:phosphoglycolate phosphatase-like HAD superfamily hydrolase